MISVPLTSLINSTNTDPDKYKVFKYVVDLVKRWPGVWLAGGSIRRVLADEDLDSDWDFFFKDEIRCEGFKYFLLTNNDFTITELEHREKNISIKLLLNKIEAEVHFQLINFKYYENLTKVLDSFDYSICMFGTDGYTLEYGDKSMDDIRDKSMSVHTISLPISSVRRLLKYGRQGYNINNACIEGLLLQSRDIMIDSIVSSSNGPSSA